MKKIFIDVGHGGKDTGAVANGIIERDVNLTVALEIEKLLIKNNNFEVMLSRKDNITYLSLDDRTNMANKWGADLFISVHHNAAANTQAKGAEVIHTIHTGTSLGDEFSVILLSEFSELGTVRNVFSKESTKYPGTDYYSVIKNTKMTAVIGEYAFLTNLSDAEKVDTYKELQAEASAYVNAILDFYSFNDMLLTSANSIDIIQVQKFAVSKNPKLVPLVDIYFNLATKLGINPVLAFAQMCHETGYLYLVKSAAGLDESYHNPCGLKITQGGGDYQATAHKKFETWEDGIQAHLDHLALYIGLDGYPKADTQDPRHFPYLKGTAKTVMLLGGKWSPSPDYGTKIINIHKQIAKFKAKQAPDAIDWQSSYKIELEKRKALELKLEQIEAIIKK